MNVSYDPTVSPAQKTAIQNILAGSLFDFGRIHGEVTFKISDTETSATAQAETETLAEGVYRILISPARSGLDAETVMHELGHVLANQLPPGGPGRFCGLVGANPNDWEQPGYSTGNFDTWAHSVSETWAETFSGIFRPTKRSPENKTVYTLPEESYEAYLDLVEQCCWTDGGGGGGHGGPVDPGNGDDGSTPPDPGDGGGGPVGSAGEVVVTSTTDAGTIYGNQAGYIGTGGFLHLWEVEGETPDWYNAQGGRVLGNEGETLYVSMELHYLNYQGVETVVGAIFDMILGHESWEIWPINLEYSQEPDTTPTGSGNNGTVRVVGDITIPPHSDADPDPGWPVAYVLRGGDNPPGESVETVSAGVEVRLRFHDPYTL